MPGIGRWLDGWANRDLNIGAIVALAPNLNPTPESGRSDCEKLEREYPSAGASLMKGMEECFTINRLDVPPSLHRCLATTHIIESPHAGVRMRTRRVCRWRDRGMVKRWMASTLLAPEKNFWKIMGNRDLWVLDTILHGSKFVTRREAA